MSFLIKCNHWYLKRYQSNCFKLNDRGLLCSHVQTDSTNGPLTRYAKSQVAHAPGMPGTFSPQPRVSDPDMHHGTCATHVPWCMPGPLSSGLLWSWWCGKRSRHSRRLRNLQFFVSGKRPMAYCRQLIGHYLKQSSLRSVTPYSVTSRKWVSHNTPELGQILRILSFR